MAYSLHQSKMSIYRIDPTTVWTIKQFNRIDWAKNSTNGKVDFSRRLTNAEIRRLQDLAKQPTSKWYMFEYSRDLFATARRNPLPPLPVKVTTNEKQIWHLTDWERSYSRRGKVTLLSNESVSLCGMVFTFQKQSAEWKTCQRCQQIANRNDEKWEKSTSGGFVVTKRTAKPKQIPEVEFPLPEGEGL